MIARAVLPTMLLWLCGALAGAAGAPVVQPQALSDLRAGEWYEVPDSHLESVAASEAKFPWLRGGIGTIIGAWAGGAFDAQRDRLYIGPGGGHGGYNGNEVYAFDLHDLKWHRLNDPDPVIPGTEYTDVNKAPFAMHTYDGVEYLPPPADRYLVVGGWGTPRTYTLDPDHPDHWEIWPDHGSGRTGDICAYDSIQQLLFLSTPISSGKLSQFDPLTHRWTLRKSESPRPSYYETADFDPRQGLMVSCGKGLMKSWRLAPIPAPIEFAFLESTGGADVVSAPSPGFCYDSAIDRFVGWSSGADVYTFDTESRKWTRHAPAATNRVTPGPPDQWGTFGRFRYVPSMNLFILVNSVKQNVFLYRLSGEVPNVITGVEATALGKSIDSNIPTPAISVKAVYADGSRRDVTDKAIYFALDPQIAGADVRGKGIVTGMAGGNARFRAVYTDPAFRRGFAGEVELAVKDIVGDSTLNSIGWQYDKVTLIAGDDFPLIASGNYTHGADHFSRPVSGAIWSSDTPQIATVSGGLVHAIHPGGPVTVRCIVAGKSVTASVTVVEHPEIRRISFNVKGTAPKAGWDADNGQPYSDARGFGWVNAHDLSTRDDRKSAKNPLLMTFVKADEQKFRVNVPNGPCQVRAAMGDADYGAPAFENWISLGERKLLYYEGWHNTIATNIVNVEKGQLTFAIRGPINYLIIAPIGIDLNRYADDGSTVRQ